MWKRLRARSGHNGVHTLLPLLLLKGLKTPLISNAYRTRVLYSRRTCHVEDFEILLAL